MSKAEESVTEHRAKSLVVRTIILLLVLALGGPVLAHGDAQWIADGKYQDRKGVHCCGEHDCAPVGLGEVVRSGSGWLHVPTNTRLEDGDPGIHPSEREIPFRCVRGGEMKCLFLVVTT